MPSRFIPILAITAALIALPATDAVASARATGTHGTTVQRSQLPTLHSLANIKIGANTTVITIKNTPGSRPIVIDYGRALRSGVLAIGNNGGSRIAKGDAARSTSLPRGLPLWQITATALVVMAAIAAASNARRPQPVRVPPRS